MKIVLAAVGKARGPAAELIAEYEARAKRYFPLDVAEVKEEAFRRAGDAARGARRRGEAAAGACPRRAGDRGTARDGEDVDLAAAWQTGWASWR